MADFSNIMHMKMNLPTWFDLRTCELVLFRPYYTILESVFFLHCPLKENKVEFSTSTGDWNNTGIIEFRPMVQWKTLELPPTAVKALKIISAFEHKDFSLPLFYDMYKDIVDAALRTTQSELSRNPYRAFHTQSELKRLLDVMVKA